MQQKNNKQATAPLREGTDYYLEKGAWVFTEHFLRSRGYCCGSGCRHCPYDKNGGQEIKGNSEKGH
jgi:Family of unknown function (DUF5522)